MKTQKTWFITGASKGFGFEIAKAALQLGHKVVATVRNNPQQLTEILGNPQELLVTTMDVTYEEQVKKAVSEALQHFGNIDILVNNAGFGLISAIEEATDAEARKQFDTNVFGLLNVTRAIMPHMRAQRSGHVINISALFAFGTIPGWGIYSATKAAVEGITEALALEGKPLGINVTVVEPGMFTTNFLDGSSFMVSKNVIDDYKDTSGQIRSLTASFNGTQPGDPKKLAEALLVLINAENPPVHLPLGKDCIAFYEKNKETRENEMKTWKELTESTDHTVTA